MSYKDEYQLAITNHTIELLVDTYIHGDNPGMGQILCDDVPHRARVVPEDEIHAFLEVLRNYAQRLQARIDQKNIRSDSPTLEGSHGPSAPAKDVAPRGRRHP